MTWPHVDDHSWQRGRPLKHLVGDEKVQTVVVYASTVTADSDGRRLLRPGVILAEITSGVGEGKFGPYDPDASDGRQTLGVNNSVVLSKGLDVTLGDLPAGGYWMDCVFRTSEIRARNKISASDVSALKTAFPACGWK